MLARIAYMDMVTRGCNEGTTSHTEAPVVGPWSLRSRTSAKLLEAMNRHWESSGQQCLTEWVTLNSGAATLGQK